MTSQILIVLVIFLLFIALILSGKVKIHVAAMMIPIALEITGVLGFKDAWGGMLNSSIVMMAAMFVVGAAVGKTSIVSKLSKTLIKDGSSDFKIMLGIAVPIILLSCVVNATGSQMLDIPYHRIDQFQKGTNEFAVVNIWAFIPSPVIIVDHYTSPAFPFLAEEPGKQGNQSDTDEGHTATGHQLLHTLRLC